MQRGLMDGRHILKLLASDVESAVELSRNGWAVCWIYVESDDVPIIYFTLTDVHRFESDTLEKFNLVDCAFSIIRKDELLKRQRARVRRMYEERYTASEFRTWLQYIRNNLFNICSVDKEKLILFGAAMTDEDTYYIFMDTTGNHFSLVSTVGKIEIDSTVQFYPSNINMDALRDKLLNTCDLVIVGRHDDYRGINVIYSLNF